MNAPPHPRPPALKSDGSPRLGLGVGGLLAGVAISLGILALLYLKTGVRLQRMLEEWEAADGRIVAAALAFSVAFHVFVGAHKLNLILRSMGVPITLGETVRVRLGEGPLRVLLPLKGGEVVTALFFWRHKAMPAGDAAGAMVFDRGLNFMGTGLWLLLGMALSPELDGQSGLLAVALLCLAAVAFLFAVPLHDGLIAAAQRIHGKLGRFAGGLLRPWRGFPARRKLMFLGYGVLFVSRPLLVCALLFAAFHISPHPGHVLAYTALATLAGTMPGPLMGMGPRETAIAGLFAGYVPSGSGIALSVGMLLTLTVYLVPFLVGVPWVPWFLGRIVGGQRPGAGEEP